MSLGFDDKGDAVAALHEALAANGQTVAPDEIKEQRFGDSTRQAIVALQKKAGLPPSGVVDSATALTIGAVGIGAGPGQPSVVQGQVRSGDGTPLARVTVRAFDRDLRHEQPLGETTTDETGWYVIRYKPTKFCRSPGGDSDLVVRAYSDKNAVLQTSPVIFNAPNPATINLVVGPVLPSGPSEFEQVARCLTPLFDGVVPADVTRADIIMLRGESGLDQLVIAYYVLALRLANQTDLPAALFFGLAREGIGPALSAILATPLEESRAALVRALADNIIPQGIAKDLDGIIVRMRTLRSDPARLPFGKILATTLPDVASQSRLIDQFASSKQEPVAIWKSLERDAAFGPDKVKQAQLALQLGAVTIGHAPLVAALIKEKQVTNPRDLAKLSQADWAALIRTAGAPDVLPGADAATKAAHYANTLVRVVEDAFPTAAFANNLRASSPTSGDLADFLDTNPTFDLKDTHIDSFLPDAAKQSDPARAVALTTSLKRTQRLFRVSPRYRDVAALQSSGLDSATDIVRIGRTQFVNQHAETLGGADRAATVYDQAAQASAVALAQFGRYASSMNALALTVLPTPSIMLAERAGPHTAAQVLPDYQSLFGALKLCNCEECQSILSPAAYLVDLLNFIQQHGGAQALNLLNTRRPDIQLINLDCHNTNTALPYVDLVNEVLENALSNSPQYDRQTTRSADLLSVAPEHVNGPVYDTVLNQSVYPWTLPFEFGSEAGRAFLGQLGVTRDALMSAFRGPTVPADGAIAAEALGLATLEARIITGGLSLKAPVRTATTANIDLNNTASLDGVALSTGDRVLVKNQTTSSQNGIYQAMGGGVLARARDAADATTIQTGLMVVVVGGPQNGTRWVLTTPGPIVVDTTALTFTQSTEVGEIDAFAASGPLYSHWGFAQAPNPDVATALATVETFLDHSGIDLRQLHDLLNTAYANPQNDLSIDFSKDVDANGNLTCDLTLATIKNLGGRVTTAKRMLRFLRLQRRLGVTAHELDLLLTSLGAPDITDVFLAQIVEVQRLATKLNLTTETVAALFGTLDTADPTKSLYEQVYRNFTVNDPPDPIFGLNAQRTEVAAVGAPISVHSLAVIAALQISATDLALLVGTEVPDALSLANLSRLYRIVTLAQSANLSIQDFLALKALTGIDPFDRAHVENARKLVELNEKITKAGFNLAEVSYLLRHADATASGMAPDPDAANRLLASIRDGLKQIFDATETPALALDTNALRAAATDALGKAVPAEQVAPILAVLDGTTTLSPAAQAALINQYFVGFWNPTSDAVADLAPGHGTSDQRFADTLHHLTGTLAPLAVALKAGLAKILNGDAPETAVAITLGTSTLATPDQANFVNAQFAIFLSTAQVSDVVTQLVNNGTIGNKARLDYLLPLVFGYLRTTQRDQLLRQKLGDALSVPAALVRALLATVQLGGQSTLAILTAPTFLSGTATTFTTELDLYVVLQKAAMLAIRLKLKANDVTALDLVRQNGHAAMLHFSDLPHAPVTDPSLFDRWRRLIDLVRLARNSPGGTAAAFALLAENDATKLAAESSAAFTWNATDLADIATQLGVPARGFQDSDVLGRVQTCFDLLRHCNVPAKRIIDRWIVPTLPLADAEDIKQTLKLRYDKPTWLSVAKPLVDGLRDKQRAALVAQLIGPIGGTFANSDDLFANFLIDVEMTHCQTASRIQRAIGSVQLFINRGMMSLEPFSFTREGVKDWAWMKLYRVWEANREIFLYPENWIDPQLRDDKSPFFRDLESALRQNDISADTAEAAFVDYLEKLELVSRLEVAGMYQEDFADEDGTQHSRLHVVARTVAMPHKFYYRWRDDGKIWSAWERIDLDIESDQVMPIVFNRRLHIYWPVFKTLGDQDGIKPADAPAGTQFPRSLEIRIAWSEYKKKKWTARRVSRDDQVLLTASILTSRNLGPEAAARTKPSPLADSRQFFFKAGVEPGSQGNDLVVRCIYRDEVRLWFTRDQVQALGLPDLEETDKAVIVEIEGSMIGKFRFVGAVSDPTNASPGSVKGLEVETFHASVEDFYVPTGTRVDGNAFLEVDDAGDTQENALEVTQDDLVNPVSAIDIQKVNEFPVLDKTPGQFRVLWPHQAEEFTLQQFFYEDQTRAFLVTPERDKTVRWQDGYSIYPGADKNIYEQYYAPRRKVEPDLIANLSPLPVPPTPAVIGVGDLVQVGVPAHDLAVLPPPSVPFGALGTHQSADVIAQALDESAGNVLTLHYQTDYPYLFENFYHPYVGEFVGALNGGGIDGLLRRDIEGLPDTVGKSSVAYFNDYAPRPTVDKQYPPENVDFSLFGAYSIYNWEVFFHAPLLIAEQLSKNQRFADAQRWFHYIFNPTDQSSKPAPARYWNFYPFFREVMGAPIEDLLAQLDFQPGDPRRTAIEHLVADWRLNPFNPHRIARMRISAYAKTVVMKYLDNLIAWADNLFRQDKFETIDQATQLYVLAAQILGARPREVTLPTEPHGSNFKSLSALNAFSNQLVPYENLPPGLQVQNNNGPPIVLGTALEFCVPKNPQLLTYWDTVAARLFKIRHCMNIEGIVQQLPLFSPPIDPGLLVKAAAAGVDLTSALSDVYAPSPIYRFTTLLQKANELCADVRALGSALLTVLDKRDGEALALLRQSQELGLLNAVRSIKAAAVDEAQANLDAQKRARDAIAARFTYYSGRPFMNASELSHFANLEASLVAQGQAHEYEILSSALRLLPTATIGIAGAASSPFSTVELGGPAIGGSMSAVASAFNAIAATDSGQAQMAQVLAGYQRRFDDWQFQATLAAIELKQADKSIAAAELRLAMAQKDLDNQDLQIDSAQAIDDFLRAKFTNEDLYDFMVGQILTVYFQSYQLAYEMAKRAQRAFQFELGDASASFIQFGHWDSLRNGLTAGEQLQLDLHRLEIGYLDENRRELEITKHVSLATFAPSALVQLRESGTCGFTLPEEIYDYDFPGHYMRRIKSVSLTIPCVVGPYIGVNCTLTLLSDTVRTNPIVQTPYAQNTKQDDSRFRVRFGVVQSIATSGGQSDSGLFELNFRDERYLPFEGAGAISAWRLDLPLETNLFDRETLTDVVLHVRYTARDGGDGLRSQALTEVVRATRRTGVRIFSARQSFSAAWHQFLFPPDSPSDPDQMLALDFGADRLPVLLPGAKIRIEKVDVLLKLSDTPLVQGADPPSGQYDESLSPLLAAPAPENQPIGPLPLRRDFLFGGLPHATFPDANGFKPARAEGAWLLTFREQDMTTLQDVLWTLSPGGHKRLIPDAIDDLFMIVTFGVT